VAAKEKKEWTTYIAKHSITNLQNTYNNPYIAAEISYSRSSSDLDNLAACFKSVLDGLVTAEIIKDDDLTVLKPIMLYRAVKIKTKESPFFRLFITDCSVEYRKLALRLLED
jgi:Holliday junction resolvase RusA-like endonuclease